VARIRDVIIVGAGPAGTATAAALHQRGVRDVLVLDRSTFPRDKPCGGGLTGHVDGALATLGLRLSVPHVPAMRARVRFGAFERTVLLRRPVNVVRRVEFDRSLVEQVQALGVPVATGDAVKALAVGAGAVTVRLASGTELAARVVVGADGVASVVRRHLRGTSKRPAHRLLVHELGARLADDAMTYDFTPMLAGVRGYLWVFPVTGGRVNVGVMHYPSRRCAGSALLQALSAGLARYGIELPERGVRGWPVWGYDPRAPVAAPRLLTVGDAAGIDALTGEGIAVAMEQAQVAADAVARALASGDLRFTGYRRALRTATVGRELALDRVLASKLYQAGPGWQRWMSMALFDPDVLQMYAARVAGSEVMADHKRRLWRLLGRHLIAGPARRRRLAEAMAGGL
jgi:geranylgeranyl reductase family protein